MISVAFGHLRGKKAIADRRVSCRVRNRGRQLGNTQILLLGGVAGHFVPPDNRKRFVFFALIADVFQEITWNKMKLAQRFRSRGFEMWTV